MIRQYENGQTILHEITNINRAATYLGRNDFSLSGGSSSFNNQSVPQNGENVNNDITRLADLGYDISKDMGGKAKKALDKTADIANEHRLGGTLDTRYDSDKSIQKLEDVIEGKTSFDDYMNEQRELMWQSFKDSNRGTESFLHKDENGNFDRRDTVSNNGSLYRQLYEEYGGRPTKAAFNEALDDVLANGQNSKYYDGFREFDHDGERSIFDFNQGNENIGLILELKEEMDSQKAATLAEYRESLTQNNNESVPRETLKNLTDTLSIDIKDGAQKISGTNMEKMSGRNLNPRVVNIDEIFSDVTDKNARSFRKKAFDLAASLFNNKQVVVEDTGTSTQINKKGLRKTFSDNTPPSKIQSANKIGQIVEQGIYGYTTTNHDSTDGILYHHFFTPVNYGGENGVVRTVIKEYTNEPSTTNKYYYHQMELLDGTKNGGTPSITPSRRTNVALEGSASNDSIVPQDNTNVNGRSYEKETENLPEDFDETPTVGPTQQKSRLSGESSVSDTTDSLRALSRSGEIGNNHILTQDSENVNDYDSALVQPNNPEIRQTVCCVLVLLESNYDIIRMFKVIIQYR